MACHREIGIDVQPGEVPKLLAGFGIEAKDAVLAGAEENLAAGHAGTRFRVTGGRKIPQFLASRRFQAVKLAVGVLVKSFTDIKSAVVQARSGEDGLHVALIVEFPKLLAG